MQGAQMRLYNLIVSSRQGSCPCRTRANTFKIVQDLPGQGEKSTCCLSALHADRDEQLSGRFHQGKNVAGSQSGCGVIQDFFSSPDVDRRSTSGEEKKSCITPQPLWLPATFLPWWKRPLSCSSRSA